MAFIRLAIFTGLGSEELLELCWDDVDQYGSRLRIRNVTKAVVAESGMQQTYLARFIPLPPHVLHDLLEWHNELYGPYIETNSFAGYRYEDFVLVQALFSCKLWETYQGVCDSALDCFKAFSVYVKENRE